MQVCQKWYPEQPQKCRCFSQAQKKGKMRTEIGRLNSGSILSLGCLILGACFQPNLGSETAVAATAAQHVAMHSAACGLEFLITASAAGRREHPCLSHVTSRAREHHCYSSISNRERERLDNPF